jgi:hypothetical protein
MKIKADTQVMLAAHQYMHHLTIENVKARLVPSIDSDCEPVNNLATRSVAINGRMK